ncbi:MAG: BamA/TamA family outer membrane protein [Bacteroidetes bacterium]|nr:BamA/TamA family outer membrane protein [Bacteroidota bacterium]
MKKFYAACITMLTTIAGLYPCTIIAQDRGTVKTSANAGYDEVSKFKRVVLGEHYRKEWSTEVDVQILNMDLVAGGLTPLKLGGGKQTKSLRLQGADGKEYVLRSVNKDPSKALPAEMVGTFANDIVQDQISSSNPYAPLAVASLANSAGIFHTTPKLVYVPKSARLGEFEKIFAGTVCLLEERPMSSEQGNPDFGYSKNIVNSEKLFEKISGESNHQVDERAFLKARIFDMWIGDWDRHEDQWLWASFKKDDKTIYQPIPRDRDQAFSKLDGLLPKASTQRWAIRKVKDFDYTIKDINGLNINGYLLDRSFTTRLVLKDWIEVTRDLQVRLTDSAIETAFTQMPEKIFNISGKETIAKLKRRRDDLQKYTHDYYEFLSKEVNVVGSDQKEIFDVRRIDNDSTRVVVYKAGKNNKKDDIIYDRTFIRSETNEIRLYGLGANDVFDIEGKTHKGILVRVVGGTGEDKVIDSSSVDGLVHKTKIYDDQNNIFNVGTESREFISHDSLKNEYNRKAFRYDWLGLKQSPGYNPDDGVYVGGGIIFKKQQFGKQPYGWMQSVWMNYAFSTGAYNIAYDGTFKQMIGKWDLNLFAKMNMPSYRNYYGMGNETVKETSDIKYYRVRSNQIIASPSLSRQFAKQHTVGMGAAFQYIRVEQTSGRFVSDYKSNLDSGAFGKKYYISAFVNYQFNTIDNPLYPRRGYRFASSAVFTKNTNESKSFLRLSAESSVFFTKGKFTTAIRTGVATNIGNDYEFFQANTLSGITNLRGFNKDRFAGKTSFFNNAELRFKAGTLKAYILRGEFGVLGFFDNGRVWIPNETSNTWHHGYGGGIWILPYNKIAFTATYGATTEGNRINIKAGFLF